MPPAEGAIYRNFTATTATAVHDGVRRIRHLALSHATGALRGDGPTFLALDRQRKQLAEELGSKTRAASLKRNADEAFRLGDYAEASRLFEQIRSALSPAETMKADLARERAASGKAGRKE